MINLDRVSYYQNMSQSASNCMRLGKYIMIIGVVGSLIRYALGGHLGLAPLVAAIGFVNWVGFDILEKKMRSLYFVAARDREMSYEISHGRISAEVTSYTAGRKVG